MGKALKEKPLRFLLEMGTRKRKQGKNTKNKKKTGEKNKEKGRLERIEVHIVSQFSLPLSHASHPVREFVDTDDPCLVRLFVDNWLDFLVDGKRLERHWPKER
eukprot:Hpha_TRINITY_DN10720_c0_g1::TRINITY_DN10720_c0_g1_i1::g.43425::m.43425